MDTLDSFLGTEDLGLKQQNQLLHDRAIENSTLVGMGIMTHLMSYKLHIAFYLKKD
jgi:hypothetical protein